MPIQQWSERIVVVELNDEPQLTDDLQALHDRIDNDDPVCVVINMAGLTQISSSHLASLLHARQKLIKAGQKMRVCSVPNAVWGIMLVARLDKVFDLSPDVTSALAALQLRDP